MKLLYEKCKEAKTIKVSCTNCEPRRCRGPLLSKANFFQVLENQNLLQEIFKDIQKIGSWPVLKDNWDEKTFNLNGNFFLNWKFQNCKTIPEMLLSLIRLGVSNFGFFEIIISSDAFVEINPVRNFPTRENLSDVSHCLPHACLPEK